MDQNPADTTDVTSVKKIAPWQYILQFRDNVYHQ